MDSIQKAKADGLLYRLNAGYRFRVAGSNAHNDGIHADIDIGYQSQRFAGGHLSLETGSSIDLFGETSHLGAYLQLNYHATDRWILSLRSIGAGAEDDKEASSATTQVNGTVSTTDREDFGGLFEADLLGSYRLDRNLLLGLRCGYNLQAYGHEGGDQGTQHSIATLLNLAYHF